MQLRNAFNNPHKDEDSFYFSGHYVLVVKRINIYNLYNF